MLIEIKNLTVSVEEKKILDDFSLTINPGETHVIMGPNGTGKSTLSKVLLGDRAYPVEAGDILVDGESILSLTTDERARCGMFLAMQNPISIPGVKNSEFLRTALLEREEKNTLYQFMRDAKNALAELSLPQEVLHRSLNEGFSGGERKKMEVLQLKLLKPTFLILDELDSGLDVDSLKIVCQNINAYLTSNPLTSVLIITHYPRILEYLTPKYVHMMREGRIQKTGDLAFAYQIEKEGYHGINEVGEEVPHE